jgi:hypothetical protein
MSARFTGLVVFAVVASAAITYFAHPGSAGVITPYATGSQTIQSGPGVYAQTTPEYSGSWSWVQQSASYAYYWYLFTSGGTLVKSGSAPAGGNGSTGSVPANVYYFKEYNNEPAGSGHLNILTVSYCC